MKYVLIYYGGGMAQSEKERTAVMKAWGTWFGKLGKAVVDGGDPFSRAAKNVASDGQIKDGPIGQMASGYSILEAKSLAAATALAKGCPVLKSGGRIAVYETQKAM